ncbi:MAG: ribulose-phosphate 3-epimerase [Victivallales bacterium]|nr:ribulose-phosphate 3-epimerase [Victivallales bacterium]
MKLKQLSNNNILIAPSLLAADFSNLKKAICGVEEGGADLLHLDIMDGHFVPNLTIGPPLIKSIRKYSGLIFDAHLMITDPLKYVESFVNAGADHITFHVESNNSPREVIEKVKYYNKTAGISIKPKTSVESVLPYLSEVDMILVMTVEPGFGGQKFMPDMMDKVRVLREKIKSANSNVHIQVDGGINEETVKTAFDNGANNFVAGTSVFRHPMGVKAAIDILKKTMLTA